MILMMLFQKKLSPTIEHFNQTSPLEQWSAGLKEDYCFYYNWIDQLYDFRFDNFLTDTHINFLRQNPNIKIVYDFNGEPIVENILLDILETAQQWKLNDDQIILIVSNILQTNFVNERLKEIRSVRTYEWNYDIKTTLISQPVNDIEKKKFSTTCRLHRPWRSYIICRLKERHLIDNFHFSFMGCENNMTVALDKVISENKDISITLAEGDWSIIAKHDKIKKDLTNICGMLLTADINDFIDQCPHYIEKERFKTDVETPQEIFHSDFHLVIENGFFDLNESAYTVRSFEMGEKTWKAIIASKPFLVYSDPGYLHSLKKLGFKTFDPWIDESYDNETDPKSRAEMIIDQIEKINRLSIEEYTNLLLDCKSITEHNFSIYFNLKSNQQNFTDINFNKI